MHANLHNHIIATSMIITEFVCNSRKTSTEVSLKTIAKNVEDKYFCIAISQNISEFLTLYVYQFNVIPDRNKKL